MMTISNHYTSNGLAAYSMCLALPVFALLFLTTGPHSSWSALLWVLPLWLIVLADIYGPPEKRCVPPNLPGWPFNSLLYMLAAFQVANIVLLLEMTSRLSWGTGGDFTVGLVNLYAVKVICGISSSFSGIVVAHELIHRRKRHMKGLGRFLLILACYEHFFTEHIRGHHQNFATTADPATARFGESFEAFWWRTIPGQFRHAWEIENERLGITRFADISIIQHRVMQGILLEICLLAMIAWIYGAVGLIAFLLTTISAIRKLEAVNYIEHWGLSRKDKLADARLSWDTDSWWTLHTLVGLSRHADHHTSTSKPYQKLRCIQESPKLPSGYFGSVYLTVFMNKRFQKLATAELKKRRLGPFHSISAV